MEAQDVFDRVVRHLGALPRQASVTMDDGGVACRYRTDDGLCCAVGCLLTEAEVRTDFNGKAIAELEFSVTMMSRNNLIPRRLLPHLSLLHDLQQVHDDRFNWHGDGPANRSRMRRDLMAIATSGRFTLDHGVVDEVFPGEAEP